MLTRLDTETLRVTLEPKRNDVCGEPTYCMAGGTLPWGGRRGLVGAPPTPRRVSAAPRGAEMASKGNPRVL